MRSMSFFHSIPSDITLCHSLHTSSAAHRERASRKDRMFSAMWSKPWARERERKGWNAAGNNFWMNRNKSRLFRKLCKKAKMKAHCCTWSYCYQVLHLYLAAQWWSPSAAWVWGRSWCGRAGSGTYGRSGARQTLPGRPQTTGQTERCSVPSLSHSSPLMDACGTPQRDHYYAVKGKSRWITC